MARKPPAAAAIPATFLTAAPVNWLTVEVVALVVGLVVGVVTATGVVAGVVTATGVVFGVVTTTKVLDGLATGVVIGVAKTVVEPRVMIGVVVGDTTVVEPTG